MADCGGNRSGGGQKGAELPGAVRVDGGHVLGLAHVVAHMLQLSRPRLDDVDVLQ